MIPAQTIYPSTSHIKQEQQYMLDIEDLLTGEEDYSILSHISIGSADTDLKFEMDEISRVLHHITTGHQQMLSSYHNLAPIQPAKH